MTAHDSEPCRPLPVHRARIKSDATNVRRSKCVRAIRIHIKNPHQQLARRIRVDGKLIRCNSRDSRHTWRQTGGSTIFARISPEQSASLRPVYVYLLLAGTYLRCVGLVVSPNQQLASVRYACMHAAASSGASAFAVHAVVERPLETGPRAAPRNVPARVQRRCMISRICAKKNSSKIRNKIREKKKNSSQLPLLTC